MNFDRNLGLISDEEQKRLQQSTVAVAGVGGDGGLVAEGLARLGVGSLVLADPETFEKENLNRQNGSSIYTIGRNKAEVLAEIIQGINPDAEVRTYTKGVTPENAADFLDKVDLLVDETEFTMPYLAVLLGRQARTRRLVMLTGFNVGFGTVVTSFVPDGQTIENYLGLSDDVPLDPDMHVPLDRWLPRLPAYIDGTLVEKVSRGEVPAPTVMPGVQLAAGVVITEAYRHLVGRETENAIVAPDVFWFDAFTRQSELIST